MGAYGRPPDPFDALKQNAPRTGPPANNSGGFPPLPPPPAVKPPNQPATSAGRPGPTQGAQPAPINPGLPPAPQAPAAPAGITIVQAPQAQPSTVGPPAAPQPAPSASGHRIVGQLDYVPAMHELEALGAGNAISTPHGEVYRDPATGALAWQRNQVGEAAYQAERASKAKAFGSYPWMHDPAAPAPPIEPGQPSYNPFAPRGSEWS
jgi:hypothetical protein